MSKILNMAKKVVLLQKPSGTIMIGGALTKYERKLYNGFLKVAHDSLKKNPDEDWFSVPFEELKQVLSLKESDKNHNYLKSIMKKMNTIQVEYNLLQKDGRVWGVASLLDNIQIKKAKDGHQIMIRFTIPKIVTETMVQQNNNGFFAKIDLIVIKGLHSRYSVLIYEIITDYSNVEIPEMTINKFRKIFGIEKKYPKIRDVKRRVLNPACQELNTNPAIPFEIFYEFKKQGNKYTHIKFQHNPKPPEVIDIQPGEPLPIIESKPKMPLDRLFAMIPEKHRNKKTIRMTLEKALKKYGEEYCHRNIQYTNKHAIRNYRTFLDNALKNDWALGWWEDEQEKRKQKVILDSIKNTRIEINGEVYKTDQNGFIFGKNWVLPPGEVLKRVLDGKAKISS